MFNDGARLHLAIQKSGRLSDLSQGLLRDATATLWRPGAPG